MEESDARQLLQATQTYRQESDTWHAAYLDLRTEFTTSMDQASADIRAIEDQIKADKKAQNSKTFWNVGIPTTILCILLLMK
jgi:hypothetical protein